MNERRRGEDKVNTSVRFPPDLHERLVREAQRQDRSVSSLVVHYCRKGVREDERQAEAEEGETNDR